MLYPLFHLFFFIYIYIYIYIYTPQHTNMYISTLISSNKDKLTHTHTHTHIYIYIYNVMCSISKFSMLLREHLYITWVKLQSQRLHHRVSKKLSANPVDCIHSYRWVCVWFTMFYIEKQKNRNMGHLVRVELTYLIIFMN